MNGSCKLVYLITDDSNLCTGQVNGIGGNLIAGQVQLDEDENGKA